MEEKYKVSVVSLRPSFDVSVSSSYSIGSQSYQHDFHGRHLRSRVMDGLLVRELQVYRETSIDLFRKRTGAKSEVLRSFGGKIGIYNQGGAVTGEPAGKDANGRQYKKWVVISGKDAAKIADHKHFKLFNDAAKTIVKRRCEVANG